MIWIQWGCPWRLVKNEEHSKRLRQKKPNPQGLCGADLSADQSKANLLWLSAKALELPVPVGHPRWLTDPIFFLGGLQVGLYP